VPTERRFKLPGLSLVAREWGGPEGVPVLASHGWLDNAGSFDLLAPELDGAHLVALDLAGHGQSDSRSPDGSYNIWQDVGDLLEVADQLEWPRLNLLGHSRGAIISMLFAAAFPERVDKLVLIEGGAPITGAAEDAPAALKQALIEKRTLRTKRGRIFSDRDTAIRERAQGFSKVSFDAAAILARRSLRELPHGFQWHADQRLKAVPELKLTPDLARAFIRAVQAPALMVLADDGPFGRRPLYMELTGLFPKLEIVRMPGGHHLHLENAAGDIAALIRSFLSLP
jgi:pimeloyl-ACP methyl ester carboxylesterase